nr:transposase (putative), gypsy type [Tanacetum cinerariifolium]
MVLQLTDITSEITDEEFLEFTSEYYIPLALHPVVPAANASIAEFPMGKCYTEKLDALRRWREMFFWVDNALFPWGFAFYTKESLPRDERPTPGSYSVEDAELINENRIPINAYSEAFLCHMGISCNYFHSPEKVPTFISDDGREMDLFSVVHLSKPKLVIMERTMELVLEQPEDENTAVLEPTPLRSVSDVNVDPPEQNVTCADYSQAAGITRAESETEEVNSGLKHKRATIGDGAGSSKRVCHVILGDSASTEGEAIDASPTTATKDVTKTPPPNVEAASNTSAPVTHVEQSPPKISSFTTDNLSQGGRETGPKVFEVMPADQLMEEIDMVAAHQAVLVAQLKARFFGKCSRSVQKDEEIVLLKGVEKRLEKQEGKLRKLSIEYDEELYPHQVSSIAERRWLISHGLRLVAMCTLESQECALARGRAKAVEELHENKLLTVPAAQVHGYNKDTYEELVAAMEKMKLLELPHIAQLERDQDYPIDVIMAGLTLARHDTEGAEAQSDFFLKPDVAQLQVTIFARLCDILNPFALEKEIPLKESLEAHSMRLAKKKGVKGKAILCGVGAAHLPRFDGVPVSVATVSPRDSNLLEKLKEARNAAYQVDSSERGRSHSV